MAAKGESPIWEYPEPDLPYEVTGAPPIRHYWGYVGSVCQPYTLICGFCGCNCAAPYVQQTDKLQHTTRHTVRVKYNQGHYRQPHTIQNEMTHLGCAVKRVRPNPITLYRVSRSKSLKNRKYTLGTLVFRFFVQRLYHKKTHQYLAYNADTGSVDIFLPNGYIQQQR